MMNRMMIWESISLSLEERDGFLLFFCLFCGFFKGRFSDNCSKNETCSHTEWKRSHGIENCEEVMSLVFDFSMGKRSIIFFSFSPIQIGLPSSTTCFERE